MVVVYAKIDVWKSALNFGETRTLHLACASVLGA